MPSHNTYRLNRFLLPRTRGISSGPPLLTLNTEYLLLALPYPRRRRSLDVGLLLSATALFKLVLGKAEETRDQIANIRWIIKKAREFQKNIYFYFIDYAKAFDCGSQ